MVVIREPKTFYFDFDWPKDVNRNLKLDAEFIIKGNQSLAENKIKNEIGQLLLKYKLRNYIHENSKQKIGWTAQVCFSLLTKIRLVANVRETLEVQINMLLFKKFLFITRRKI